jgi:aldose 1-epimerase
MFFYPADTLQLYSIHSVYTFAAKKRIMFQIREEAFGPYTRIVAFDEKSGNGFSIVPARGATVLDITLNGVQVLDGYRTPEELSAAKWGKSALLFPFPNRLNHGRYEWQGRTYEFPINNAATENAIHGFIRDESFTVRASEAGDAFARLRCACTYDGRHEYYPFPLEFELECTIHHDARFELKAICTNQHSAPIPVGFGWHPYFKLAATADEHLLQLPGCEQVAINERMIPTGRRDSFNAFIVEEQVQDTFLDNCFALLEGEEALLTISDGQVRVAVSADAADCPFFQVFTPPHRESIALEPMSCNVDAFNNGEGLVILHPAERWEVGMLVAISKVR